MFCVKKYSDGMSGSLFCCQWKLEAMCRNLTVHKFRATGESLMPQFLRKRLHLQEEVALRNTRQEYSIP